MAVIGGGVERAGDRVVDPLHMADEVAAGRGRVGAVADSLHQPPPRHASSHLMCGLTAG
jgi:hypothetical protein